MLLITSGEYVETELFAEFGKIPPAFLPVGNKRLYTYQIGEFGRLHDELWLTVPDDFELDRADDDYLRQHRVKLFRTRPGIPLGVAVRDFIAGTASTGRLDILYGDTLVADDDLGGSDWLALSHSDENYHWHHEKPHHGQPGGTWAGMFSFSDASRLQGELCRQTDFIDAVGSYSTAMGSMEHKMVDTWMDFGHIHTYFDSKREITTQRHFNQLQVADGVLTKSSNDHVKMQAEADWFESAPPAVKPFLPNFIGRKPSEPPGYLLEYLHLAALNELYVFGRLPLRVWKKIFSACDTYLAAAARITVPAPFEDSFVEMTYRRKTLDRLSRFSQQTGIDLDRSWIFNEQPTPSLRSLAQEAASAVSRRPASASFVHGDFCFSNILFDFRAGRLKIVDPRGLDASGHRTSYGDLRYEVGKLAHSVLGLYDFIIAGFFSLEVDDHAVRFDVLAERSMGVKELFLNTEFRGRRPAAWDCHPVMLLLFLSMLPLHVDNPVRQRALMANCMKLYLEWVNDHHTDGRVEQSILPSGLHPAEV